VIGAAQLGAAGGDDEAAQQRVGRDALVADRLLVDRPERPGDARAEPGPDGRPDRARQQPVEQRRRAAPVAGPQQQQAARLERADEPVKHELDVVHALEQERAVDHVVGPLRDRGGAQVAGDHIVVGGLRLPERPPGDRVVVVDDGDRDLEAALGQPGDVQLAQRRQGARLKQADRSPEALKHVIAQWLGEEAVSAPLCARSATLRSRHEHMVIE